MDFHDQDLRDKDIVLNPDNLAVLQKKVRDVMGAMATLADCAKQPDGINAELARNVLYVSEHNLVDLGKLLGVETDSAKDVERRNAMLREANMRVHALEAQLGAAQNVTDVQAGVKHLAERVGKWWRYEGFGHVSETHFERYGCHLDLSCHLFGHFRIIDSETPVSDKEAKQKWHAWLTHQGFVLVNSRGELAVEDCEATRAALRGLLAKRMPSALIQSFVNQGSEGHMLLRSVKVYVRNIAEMAELPVDPNPSADD
jgi:hypothetical protein